MKNIHFVIGLLFLSLITALSCTRQYDEELKIYFVRYGNIYQMTESGGDVKLLLGGAVYDYPCPSPDGKYLVCKSGSVSAIFNLETLILWKTLPSVSPYTHSWSPDGTKIAATGGPGTIRVFDVASGIELWVSANGGHRSHYFTIDSLFISDTTGLNEIKEYLPVADIVPEKIITLPAGTYNNLSLSYDGSCIVGDNGSSIILINYNTLTVQTLTSGIQPSFSPDSGSIVYVNLGNIYVCNINGTVIKQLTFSGVDSYPCVQYKPK